MTATTGPASLESPPGPDAKPARDATAVIVNYNSGHRLGPLLDRVQPEVRATAIVDNASSDGSLAAAEGRSDVTIVRNTVNRGFAAAANQGAANAESDWVLFVNPDIHLTPGDITTLLSGVPDDVAAVAPLQVDEHGTPKVETGGYQPTLLRYLVWALVPVRFHRRFGPYLAPPFPARDTELDWVSGALLGIRRAVFAGLGGFDERFFLYHEDVDFGRRAREAGYRIWVRPAVRLHHEVAHGDPSRRVLSGVRSVESLGKAFRGWRRRALGAILVVGYGLRATLGSGTGRDLARAVLPLCRDMALGRTPSSAPASASAPAT
jgi:N-acetylglucosaminyl-diphospho-decaprenol L-rhamnosyltransferase